MILQSVRQNAVALALFALITALLLSSINNLTADRIAHAERVAAQKALLEIVPPNRHDNDLLLDTRPIPEQFWSLLGLDEGGDIYIARSNNTPIAAIIPTVSPDGYNGNIAMIVGVNVDGSIAGVRVVDHRETPGLGDKIELRKSNWILDFNGRSLKNTPTSAWAVKKNGGAFDQFTGATITPRAVINQLANTLKYFEQDKSRLLALDQSSEIQSLK
jgi:electron transport complex protein RnfG